MTIATTSAEAFHSLSPRLYLQPKQEQILALFRPGVLLSRQQISVLCPMPINGVCGRVDSLVCAGILIEDGDRIDPLTNKRQKLLRLVGSDD
jgi:hypothetical protein